MSTILSAVRTAYTTFAVLLVVVVLCCIVLALGRMLSTYLWYNYPTVAAYSAVVAFMVTFGYGCNRIFKWVDPYLP